MNPAAPGGAATGARSAVEPLEGRLLLATHLAPVADTFVRNNAFKDANYGASPFLWVKTQTPAGGDSRVGFLKFNVNGFSAAEVGSATLYLAGALQAPNTPPITAGVFAVGDDGWQEGNGNVSVRRRGAAGGGGSQLTGTSLGDGYDTNGGMNWDTQPGTAASPLATAQINSGTFKTYAFDVTQYVRDQLGAGDSTVSLGVKGNEATTAFMRFISSNFDGPGQPRLVVGRAGDNVRANISAPDLGAGGGATHNVTVNYSADNPLDFSRFDTNDVRVRRVDGGALDVVAASADSGVGSSTNVTYSIAAPGGSWDRSDNGVYTVELQRDEVRDAAGNDNPARLASFRVAIDDAQAPSASIVANAVTAPGGNSYRFAVNYADDVAIDAGTLNINNVAVTGQGGSLSLPVTQVELSPDADSGQIVATYTVLAPAGEWDATDNGTYTITVRNNQVRDTAGRDISEGFGNFQVEIGPPDNEAPLATNVSAPNVTTAGGTTHDVTVTYSDNVAIDSGTIDATDVTVSGPRGNLAVSSVTASQPGDGSPRTFTYTVTPPDGSWDAGDNGIYTITVNGGAVRDTAGNAVAGASGSFNVNATGPDTEPPSAVLSSAPTVTAGGGNYSFVVTYSDNVAVRANTVEANDVLVTGPGGGALQVVGVALNPNADASQIAVTYTVAARGGGWDPTDNGQYTITLNANQVADTSNNVLPGPAQIGGFQVNLQLADNQPPSARIEAPNVTTESGSYSFTVTYSDNVGINSTTVDAGDVSVTGPGGALTVVNTQTLPGGNGNDLTVTYFVTPPGNSWDGNDNGQYTITVNGGAVADPSGNGVAAKSQTFNVNVDAPDTLGPSGTITASAITSAVDPYLITVVWQDDRAVKGNTIDANDIIVTRGDASGPRLAVTAADVTPRGGGPGPRTATYTIQAPGGGWDPSDNDTYTVTIVPSEVLDNAEHPAQPGSTTFTVNIPDNLAPAASISAPNIQSDTETGERQKIVVTYQDDVAIDITSIGSDDLLVTGPDGIGVLTPVSVTSSSGANAPGIIVTYEIDAPGGTWDVSDNGIYTVTVRAGSVQDTVGNAATGSGTFTVNVNGVPEIGPAVNTGFTIEGMATQDDGKIVVVGRQPSPNVPGGFQSVVQRRNPDGQLDPSFGTGGQVLGDPSSNAIFYAVVLTNGGIVAAGSQDGHWVLARFDLSGRPDTGFGQGGRTVTTFNATNEAAYALAVDPRDGNLVVAGGSPAGPDDGVPGDQNFAFARYSPAGVLDLNFAQNGLQLFDINGEDVVGAVTVLVDGRIVAAGSSGTDIVVFRLGANGEADGAFSGDGFLKVDALRARQDAGFFIDHSQALALQEDGKVLVGNHTADGNFAVVRIDPSGNVDSTFGDNGVAAVDFGGDDDVDSLVLQPTGEILLVGTSTAGGVNVTGVAAMDRNGGLLTGWNNGGKLTLDPNIQQTSRELHIGQLVLRAFGTRQPDGRLVVGTSDRSPTPTSSAYRRLSVPGVTARPLGDFLGFFGIDDKGKRVRYTYTVNGKAITFLLKGNARGSVYLSGDKLNIQIDDLSAGTVPCSVVIKAKGGDRRVNLGDVFCTGALKGFSAKTADLSGTMYVPGDAGKLVLGNVTGTVAAFGRITSLVATTLDGAKVLSGANLGANGELGGTSAVDADTFRQGYIGAVKVAGAITGSTIAAGLNPIDDTIGDEDDIVVGGVGAEGGPFSIIRSITAKGGADETSQFIAGGFGTAKLPKRVDPENDPQSRFTIK